MIWQLVTLGLFVVMQLNAVTPNGQGVSKETSPQLYQPKDQTDIYAIPLDEDEEDQDEELNYLEHPNR